MKIRAIMLSVVLWTCSLAPALGAVIAPDQDVGGISQAELTANWWKWMISYPAATNPVLDTTGQSSHLGSDQTPVSHPGGVLSRRQLHRIGNALGDRDGRPDADGDRSHEAPIAVRSARLSTVTVRKPSTSPG